MAAWDGWAFPFIQFGLIEKFLLLVRRTHESDVSSWPEASVRCHAAIRPESGVKPTCRRRSNDAFDPDVWSGRA